MQCLRCGAEDVNGQLAKRVERHTSQLCSSCRAKPTEKIDSALGKCKPHRGNFDLDTNAPLDGNGNLYLPGYRRCHHADCVEIDHIIPPVEFERISIYYRTGIKLTFEDQIDALMAERYSRKRK